jgi:hypothetical protein
MLVLNERMNERRTAVGQPRWIAAWHVRTTLLLPRMWIIVEASVVARSPQRAVPVRD